MTEFVCDLEEIVVTVTVAERLDVTDGKLDADALALLT